MITHKQKSENSKYKALKEAAIKRTKHSGEIRYSANCIYRFLKVCTRFYNFQVIFKLILNFHHLLIIIILKRNVYNTDYENDECTRTFFMAFYPSILFFKVSKKSYNFWIIFKLILHFHHLFIYFSRRNGHSTDYEK